MSIAIEVLLHFTVKCFKMLIIITIFSYVKCYGKVIHQCMGNI